MQVFLQVLLTDEGSRAVASCQERLAEQVGVAPETCLEPHITLGAGETDDVEALTAALHVSLQSHPAFDLHLSSLGTFGSSSGVLFLAPAHAFELVALYERLYPVLEHNLESLNELYTPGQWSPHCTLLMDLSPAQLGAGFEGVLKNWPLPLSVRADRVELCEYPSLEQLHSWLLS